MKKVGLDQKPSGILIYSQLYSLQNKNKPATDGFLIFRNHPGLYSMNFAWFLISVCPFKADRIFIVKPPQTRASNIPKYIQACSQVSTMYLNHICFYVGFVFAVLPVQNAPQRFCPFKTDRQKIENQAKSMQNWSEWPRIISQKKIRSIPSDLNSPYNR